MILVNSVPNLKSVAPKLQKLSHRKVPINVGRTTTSNEHQRHQSGKTYSLVEMKFCQDKKLYLASNKTLTTVIENHPMTKNKSFWIVTSKIFELKSCKTSQVVGN